MTKMKRQTREKKKNAEIFFFFFFVRFMLARLEEARWLI